MTEQLRETRAAGLDLRPLRENLDGDAIGPDDPSWDEARRAWNLAVDQRPAAVVLAESAVDVVATVSFAHEQGLRIAPQGTGHGAAALGDLEGTILLRTSRMRGVEIDPQARIARVEAGALWIDVVEAAAEHGLAALAGSSPDVGVVGYTLGGGLSWLSRKYGIGANQVTAIEGVTASGELLPHRSRQRARPLLGAPRRRRLLRDRDLDRVQPLPDCRGLRRDPLVPGRAGRGDPEGVARLDDRPAGRDDVGRPDPPVPADPGDPGAGTRPSRSSSSRRSGWASTPKATRLLEPLRGLGPMMDTIAPMPIAELSRLHMDPEGPAPGVGDGGMLSDVDDELIDGFVERVVGTPILSAELRHLGGAVARRSSLHGAIDAWEAPYITYALGIAPTPELGAAVHGFVSQLMSALEPWEAEHSYLNFAETRRKPTTLFSSTCYHRLRQIKAMLDPHDVIRSNHPVPAAR